jgi:hypothetical protein
MIVLQRRYRYASACSVTFTLRQATFVKFKNYFGTIEVGSAVFLRAGLKVLIIRYSAEQNRITQIV